MELTEILCIFVYQQYRKQQKMFNTQMLFFMSVASPFIIFPLLLAIIPVVLDFLDKKRPPILTVTPTIPTFRDRISIIYDPKHDHLLYWGKSSVWDINPPKWWETQRGITFDATDEVYAYTWCVDFNDRIIEKESWDSVHKNPSLRVKRLGHKKIQWDMGTTPSEFFGVSDENIKKIGLVLKNRAGDLKTKDLYIQVFSGNS